MEDFFKYFIPAFLLFSGVGIVSGWNYRKDTTIKKIYKNIEVLRDDQYYYFSVNCKERLYYRYSVNDNKGKFTEESLNTALNYLSTSLGKPTKRHMEYVTKLSAFLGGPTAGYTIKSILQKSSKPMKISVRKQILNWSKKTIYGIIGGITGYNLGRWIGSHYSTNCDSDLAIECLRDDDMWKKIEKQRLALTIIEMQTIDGARFSKISGRNVQPLKDDPITLCDSTFNESLNKLLNSIRETNIDPTSEHFLLLDEFKKTHNRVKSSDAYNELVRMIPFRILAMRQSGELENILKTGRYSEENWQNNCEQLRKIIKITKSDTNNQGENGVEIE
jgi:hypothetical protein